MTSDVAQTYYSNTAQANGAQDETLELSRMQSFVDGDEDIFDVLAHKALKEQKDAETSNAMDTKVNLINATKNKIFMSRQHRLLKGWI